MRNQTRDYVAGERIAQMRVDVGLSRRDMTLAMQLRHPGDSRMHVSERTLARIEEQGAIPTARVKFALAAQFDLLPSALWGSRIPVAS